MPRLLGGLDLLEIEERFGKLDPWPGRGRGCCGHARRIAWPRLGSEGVGERCYDRERGRYVFHGLNMPELQPAVVTSWSKFCKSYVRANGSRAIKFLFNIAAGSCAISA